MPFENMALLALEYAEMHGLEVRAGRGESIEVRIAGSRGASLWVYEDGGFEICTVSHSHTNVLEVAELEAGVVACAALYRLLSHHRTVAQRAPPG